MLARIWMMVAMVTALAAATAADEIVFTNGDRLTGTVTGMKDGTLSIESEVAGTIGVSLDAVRTFSTDADLPLKGTFIVDAPQAFTGQCGEALFRSAQPDDRKNRCTMSKSGNKVRCKANLKAASLSR